MVQTVHATDGDTTRRTLATAAEIRAALEEEFLIGLPDHAGLGDKLDKLPD